LKHLRKDLAECHSRRKRGENKDSQHPTPNFIAPVILSEAKNL
jgi:hypothetical protein